LKKKYKYNLNYSFNLAIFLTKIVEGQKKYLSKIDTFSTKKIISNAVALKKAGLIHSFAEKLVQTHLGSRQKEVSIVLKYFLEGRPLIYKLKIYSSSGRRLHMSLEALIRLIKRNPGSFYFLSTNKGVLEGTQALKMKCGGILLYKIN